MFGYEPVPAWGCENGAKGAGCFGGVPASAPPQWGDIRVKQVRRPGGHTTLKVEHDELRRISLQESVSVDHVRQVVLAEADRFTPLDDWSL